jgi:hypothetical protein
MSAKDGAFDPDGVTRNAIASIKDKKEFHYYTYPEKLNVQDFNGRYHHLGIAHQFPIPGTALAKEDARAKFIKERQVIILDKVAEIDKLHKKAAHVKSRKGRLEANLSFQTRVGDSIRRITSVLNDAEDEVNGLNVKKVAIETKPKEFVSDEDGGGVFGQSKKRDKNADIGNDAVTEDVAAGANAEKAARLAAEPLYVPSFWRLVQAGHCAHVANFLSTGFPHIDGKEPKQGNTVLMASIKRGDAAMVETLLRFNASTKVQNQFGDSPIHYCWRFWDRPADKLPVTITGDNELDKVNVHGKVKEINDRKTRHDEQGATTVAILKLLLSHGADANVRDGGGGAPLHDAARRGPIKAVKMLLQFGADSEIRNDSGQSAKFLAKQQKQFEAEQLLTIWPKLVDPHKKAEFLSEWKGFLDDVDIPIVVPSASARRVLDDLTIAEHQDTLVRWKRAGMPVIDEIVSGPLDIPLKAEASIDDKKKRLLEEKKGRAIKTKAKNEEHARVQRFVNEKKAKIIDPNLTDRERRIMRANELIAEKESHTASSKRLPKDFNTLEVPLDYYLQGKVGGGFIERKDSTRQKKLSKEELVGVGAKKKKLEEEKRRIYRNTFSKTREVNCYDYLGVGRDHALEPNRMDNRHRSAAMQVRDDGLNLKTLTRSSTASVIGVPYRREKTAEELDLERRRRDDIDPRVILRERMSAADERAQTSAIEQYASSDPASKLKEEAKRRRDPVYSGATRAQMCDDEELPSLPPNPDVKHAKALLEAGHNIDDLIDLMSLPSAQFEVMMNELEEQSLEGKEDLEAEMEKRELIKYHMSTHTAKAKAANARLSRIFKVIPEEPWEHETG